MASAGSRTTGTSDPTYNLISVAYHSLQGAENYERYAQDAQREGDQDLKRFFEEAQQQSERCAHQAKQLLASRIQGGQAATAAQHKGGLDDVARGMGRAGSKSKAGGG
jgi:rubrerythrin